MPKCGTERISVSSCVCLRLLATVAAANPGVHCVASNIPAQDRSGLNLVQSFHRVRRYGSQPHHGLPLHEGRRVRKRVLCTWRGNNHFVSLGAARLFADHIADERSSRVATGSFKPHQLAGPTIRCLVTWEGQGPYANRLLAIQYCGPTWRALVFYAFYRPVRQQGLAGMYMARGGGHQEGFS